MRFPAGRHRLPRMRPSTLAFMWQITEGFIFDRNAMLHIEGFRYNLVAPMPPEIDSPHRSIVLIDWDLGDVGQGDAECRSRTFFGPDGSTPTRKYE